MGNRNIPPETIALVRSLSAERVPQREIAKLAGVSRMTVTRIVTGTYRPALGERKDGDVFLLESIRCPGCGWKINILPCLNCKMNHA